jgi:hypothetical protein
MKILWDPIIIYIQGKRKNKKKIKNERNSREMKGLIVTHQIH